MKMSSPPRSRGRPRAFNIDKALDQATRVFWKKGYEATSMPDLTRAMGINRPSLYAAFGNKESLFRKAVERYIQQGSSRVLEAMALPTARAAVEALLRGNLSNCVPGKQRGCLLVQGSLCGGEESEPVRRELVSRRAAIETILRERFERALAEGERLPTDDAAALARYIATVSHGLAVQSAGGASREQLLPVVELALRPWSA
jgi:AcrR family transcriptional regulator